MKLPEFILLGAGKSGTTSLYFYLKEHPQIFLPRIKEIYFFAFEGEDKGEGIVTQFDDYKDLFKDAPDSQVVGEVSSVYLFRPKAPERIHHYIPNAKLIAILRDPSERAFSSYLMHVSNEHPSIINPETGKFKEFSEIVAKKHYFVQVGFYYKQLRRYYDRFDANQIRVYLYEDLVSDSASLIRDLFSFIGVDSSFTPDTSRRYKVTGIPKNKMWHNLVAKDNPVTSLAKSLLKPFIPASAREKLRNQLIKGNLEKPTLSNNLRQQLIEIYREDILQLQDLLDRDLSRWLA